MAKHRETNSEYKGRYIVDKKIDVDVEFMI